MNYIGMIEINKNIIYICQDNDHLLYGTVSNVGFMEHGREKIDTYFDLDENLQELAEKLEKEEVIWIN